MAYAADLLAQATHLANLDPGEPSQANLRRSVSAAYYALFHLLIADAIERFSPKSPQNLAARIARAFVHSEMKQVCITISQGHKSVVLVSLTPTGFSDEMRFVAEKFVEIQTLRQIADYDLSGTFTRIETLGAIYRVEKSFATWATIRLSDEANVFLAALLFGGRWAK